MRTRFLPAASVAVLFALTACTGQGTPSPAPEESYAAAPVTDDESTEVVVPNEVEPDTLLIVRAVATAENGAALSLELQVHQSTRWDDVPSQTLPAALIEDCAGLTAETFSDGKWSFTRANLTAIPTAASTAEWPEDARVGVVPAADAVYASGRGILSTDGEPACETSKSLTEGGRGAIAFGVPGDADRFTAWAGHRYGFDTAAGVTLSECSVELTTLGSTLGGGVGWSPLATASACSTGPQVEVAEY